MTFSWRTLRLRWRRGFRRGVRDVCLDAELHVEKLFALGHLSVAGAPGRRRRDVDWRHDARESGDVGEELADLMIGTNDAQLVLVGVELIAVHDAVRRHFRDLQSRAARGI